MIVTTEGNKRNIVLITLDSLRADHCSFMGYRRKTTPTIDKMAKNGLYFENAIAHSIPTAPSIFGIFTGDYPICDSATKNSKIWRNELKKYKVLAEILSSSGYVTGAFQPNPWLSSYYGFNRGFDYYKEFVKEDDVKTLIQGDPFSTKIKRMILGQMFFFSWENMYRQIINWANNQNKPYFLWILLLDTHRPYMAPRTAKKWDKNNLYLSYLHWKLGKREFKDNDRNQLINAYDDGIKYADEFVSKLKSDLEADNPIFIIHADHGEEFWDHGHFGHGDPQYNNPISLYEELIHVPLVVYNSENVGKIEKPFLLSDLYAYIVKTSRMKNIDLETIGDNFVLSKTFENGKLKISVRGKKWKLIDNDGEKELFNLEDDPKELKNLVDFKKDITSKLEDIIKNKFKVDEEKKKIRESISGLRF
ncbi:MAG: sulfatase [Petrotogales bacterium]